MPPLGTASTRREVVRYLGRMFDIVGNIPNVILMLLSLSVHEWAHAAAAVHLGDDTPIRQGRYTLNPLAHIDWIGTILLPLLGVPFGWAKPVQWNPRNIRRDVPTRRALWMVSAAGPASNIVMALLAAVGLVLTLRFSTSAQVSEPAIVLGRGLVVLNIALAVFNMIPIPPLDGSRIVDANIPSSMSAAWSKVHEYAPYLFILLIIVINRTGFLQAPIGFVYESIMTIAIRLAGG